MNWYFNASGPDLNWSVLLWCDWSSKCESWSDWLVVSQFPGSLTHLCCWAWKRETLGECTSATCQTLRQVKEHQLGFVPNNRNIKINRYCKRLSYYNLYWFFKSINSIQLQGLQIKLICSILRLGTVLRPDWAQIVAKLTQGDKQHTQELGQEGLIEILCTDCIWFKWNCNN